MTRSPRRHLLAFAFTCSLANLWLAGCSHTQLQIVNAKESELASGPERISVGAFTDALWPNFGFYDKEGAFEHQYGGPTFGAFIYNFRGPTAPLRELIVKARLSAESNDKGKPEETSEVTLLVNGIELGTQTVVPDDMRGLVYTWQLSDQAQLERLKLQPDRSNVLRFEVKADASHRHGLCIYGESLDGKDEATPITLIQIPRS